MSPEVLMSLTAAKGLPGPEFATSREKEKAAAERSRLDELGRFDPLAELMRNERRYRDILRILQKGGDSSAVASFNALLSSRYFGSTASGKGSRSSKAMEWTHAECAMACRGLEDRYFQAMRYEYALDDTAFHPVANRLFEWSLERRELERWPKTLLNTAEEPVRYLRTFVDIWMLEAHTPTRFLRKTLADPDMRQVFTNIHPRSWIRGSKIYEAIRLEYLNWIAIATAHMGRMIGGRDAA
jgi:hypothetical protein